jgi:putative membrane protein
MIHHGWWGWGSGAWGMGAWGWIAMALLWVLVILGIVWLVRQLLPPQGGRRAATEDRALEVLRERFARGEIDAEEYESRRRALQRED